MKAIYRQLLYGVADVGATDIILNGTVGAFRVPLHDTELVMDPTDDAYFAARDYEKNHPEELIEGRNDDTR